MADGAVAWAMGDLQGNALKGTQLQETRFLQRPLLCKGMPVSVISS